MKKRHLCIPMLLAVIMVVGLSLACANPMSSTAKAPAGAANTGSLSVDISSFASWLPTSQTTPVGKNLVAAQSRALAVATSVKIEVVDSGGTAVISPVTLSVYTYNTNSSTTQTVSLIPVGTNYTVKVSVFNSHSSTSIPMVTGQAAGINVADGATTAVSVHCIPVSTSPLALDAAPSVATLTSYAEKWYSLTVSSGTHYYFEQTDGNVIVGLFNGSGTYISTVSGYLDYSATFSGTLYLCAVAYYGAGNAGLSVFSTAPVLNEGSVAGPVSLTLNSVHTFKTGPSSSQSSSYYSFTTTSAGNYALDTAYFNSFATTLYSNSGFTTVVSSNTATTNGSKFTGLLASAPYYLKLTNLSSSSLLLSSGQLVDPATISANTDGEGSSTSPVSLTVGTGQSGKVGTHSYNAISYYSFTTGSGSDYRLSLSSVVPSPSSSVSVTLYSNASYTTSVGSFSFTGSNGSNLDLVLASSTVYYLSVTNNATNGALTYSLQVGNLAPPASLPTGGVWTSGSINASGASTWYQATVVGGQTYSLNWDDAYQGSGSYTLDVVVSAYQANRSTAYLTNVDSGYSSASTITVPAGQTTIFIKVSAYNYGYTGTFALKLN
jgi:hypothetical protein